MESQAIRCPSQFPIPISHNYHRPFGFDNYTTSKTRRRRWRCFSGGRSGGSRWEWDKNVKPNQRSRYSDAYATDDYEEEVEFGFRNAAEQRTWWSDDFDAEDDDEEEDDVFGIPEASIGFNWVLKVFQAFGWMIPAVVISLVLGTGQNSMIMALALPLVQSALSLAADTLWGRPEETLRTKSKRKRRPSTGSPGRTRVRKERENRNQTRKGTGDYKSWVDSNNVSATMKKMGPQDFGGWDELDNHVREAEKKARVMREENEARKQERAKISRRVKGDTPLLVRLLIAMFPFLGFWTKLF